MSESFGGVWARQWDKTVFWYQFYVFVWCGRVCVLGSCMGTQCLKFTPCCAPNLCLQQPYILPIFMQGKTGLTCRLKPLSKRQPTHHLCLSLIQFHIQNDKIVYLTLWANIDPPWPSGAGLGGEVCFLNHNGFMAGSGGRLAVPLLGALALDFFLGCKPANAENHSWYGGPYVWFLRLWVVLSEWLTLARSNSSGAEEDLGMPVWNPPVLSWYDGAWKWQFPEVIGWLKLNMAITWWKQTYSL